MMHPPTGLARRALPVARQAQIVLVTAVVAGILLAVGWGAGQLSARPMPAPEVSSASSTVHLTPAQLASLTIESVKSLGFRSERIADGRIALNSDTATQVFSQYSGRVVRVLAGIGEHVKKGQPLFTVEAVEFAQTQSDLRTARSQLKLATLAEERRHAAYDSKGGSLQDWQQAQADLTAAQTAVDSAHNRLRILGLSGRQIATLEAGGSASPITQVCAPIDGIVTDRQVGPGQFLQAGGATPLYTIGNLNTVWLVAEVREVDAPLVEVGQEVEVRVLALPGSIFRAKLTAVGSEVDPVTHRVSVRATLDNARGRLKPQMFASFSIITSAETQALAVPEEAVVREGDSARVWVVEGPDGLVLRNIRLGRTHSSMVEVLDGLKPGERVVTRGSLFIDRASQPG